MQQSHPDVQSTYCGFGVYTDNLAQPQIDWDLNNTYIQDKGINQDFGRFDSPDDFYQQHRQQLGFVKGLIFKYLVRHLMNRNVDKIRTKHKAEKAIHHIQTVIHKLTDSEAINLAT
jgi:hypothetical protein